MGYKEQKANEKLKKIYQEKGITHCELCSSDFGLTFHHLHHRYWYYKKPELLGDFNQTVLLCLYHHNKYFPDSDETIELFKKLR